MSTSKDNLMDRIVELENLKIVLESLLEDAYIVVQWPESQDFIGHPDCYLINDDKGFSEFGSSAYFVPIKVYKEITDKLNE